MIKTARLVIKESNSRTRYVYTPRALCGVEPLPSRESPVAGRERGGDCKWRRVIFAPVWFRYSIGLERFSRRAAVGTTGCVHSLLGAHCGSGQQRHRKAEIKETRVAQQHPWKERKSTQSVLLTSFWSCFVLRRSIGVSSVSQILSGSTAITVRLSQFL